MSLNSQQYFSDLVAKLQDGTITKKELDQLLYFFLNNQEIENWPNHLGSKEDVKERIREKIRLEVNLEADKHKKVIPFYRKSFFKYAVAASLVLFITFATIFINGKKEVTPVVIANTIEIGSDKATLTLGDGTTVDLNKDKIYSKGNLNSTAKGLSYARSYTSSKSFEYNYLTVPRGGQYYLKLADGTQVWLNSDSQLKFPISFVAGKTREVELVYGEAYFDVSPSTENHGSHFKVINKNQIVEVLGTQFNIKAYKDETNVFTTLVEGKVAITSGKNTQIMQPGQQTDCNFNTHSLKIKNVDVYNEISWKEGVFSFERKSLKEIMTVLSRWYDFDVIYARPEIEKKEFVGVLGRNQKIEDILNTIKQFGNIKDYQIKGKTIILK